MKWKNRLKGHMSDEEFPEVWADFVAFCIVGAVAVVVFVILAAAGFFQ